MKVACGKIFSGPPLRETFAKYNLNENDISKAIELYRKFQNESGITCNTKYNGIENVLETLKNQNKKLIVVTGKQEEIAKKILQYENLDKYFDYIIGATKDNSRVLKTEIVEYAMNFIENIDFNKCIIVGDSSSDIKTGINYNMDSIGVTYGPGDKEKLKNAGATYLVDEVEKLLEILD